MSRKFLTDIDLNLNELLNVRLQQVGTDPSSPVEGQIWENTTSHLIKWYNGTSVITLGSSDAAGTVTSVSVVSANGFSGTVADDTTDAAITIKTTVTGLLLGNGTGVAAASAGTDYLAPNGSAAALTSFPTLNQNTTGTAAGLSGTPALPNGTTATTQGNSDSTTKLATTAFVQAVLSGAVQGIQFKPTATVVATAALAAGTYSNGSSGVGATFTVTANGVQTVDGHALALGDLVLLTAQASAFQNGLYTVTTAGGSGVSLVLTRHADMDQSAEFPGAFIPVGNSGTTFANSLWLANPSGTVTVGTTSIPVTQLNGATELIAGTGITISGNTISVTSPKGKYTATIGDGSTTAITVTDGLGTIDKIATIRDATTGAEVECDKTYTSTGVTFTFTTAPASNAYKVVVIA